ACRQASLAHAGAREGSGVMEVASKHLAPSLLGMTVEMALRVTAVDGRKISFEAEVKDELDKVGVVTHARFVVDKSKTSERVKAEAAHFAALTGTAHRARRS